MWEGYFYCYNDLQCLEFKLSFYMKGFYKILDEFLEIIEGSNKVIFNFIKIELYLYNGYEQEIVVNVLIRYCLNMLCVVRCLCVIDVFEVDIRVFRKCVCWNVFGFLEVEFVVLKFEIRRKKSFKFDKFYFGEVFII